MFSIAAYPTYTLFLSFGFSTVFTLLVMPFVIRLLKRDGIGQQIRADGPQSHLTKQGTPTMGGIVILFSAFVTCLLFARFNSALVLLLLTMFATGALGFADDVESVSRGRSLGLTPKQKMIALTAISVLFCLAAVNWVGISPIVSFPGGLSVDLGVLAIHIPVGEAVFSIPWLYVIFVFFLLAGLSNAVNLTDGLDGLSSGTLLVVMIFMAMVCFMYDELPLGIFAVAIGGACVGFLWYNIYPASIFMGDTGSLALGASFAALAVLTKTEIISLVMGGLFIVEALSVIIQVVSFKYTGKRVFLMAPIHHHFEKKGWGETKVVIRFWIISAAFAALGFALYFQLGS